MSGFSDIGAEKKYWRKINENSEFDSRNSIDGFVGHRAYYLSDSARYNENRQCSGINVGGNSACNTMFPGVCTDRRFRDLRFESEEKG